MPSANGDDLSRGEGASSICKWFHGDLFDGKKYKWLTNKMCNLNNVDLKNAN